MPIDPDIPPILDALEQRIQAQIDAQGVRLDEQSRHLANTGDQINALHSADKGLERQIADLAARVAKLEQGTPVWQPAFPGDTQPGTIRWGCSHQGNGVPTSHETDAGVPVGVRRTFWSMSKVSGMVSTARADIAAGRVPWVSVKLGASWATVAAGGIDAQLRAAFDQLGALGGPVWFTAHHEPENDPADGTPADWRAMQGRVRQVLNASGATNVAFASILMAWTFDSRSGRKPVDWWVDGIWDFVGLDNYVEANQTTVRTTGWNNALEFYGERDARIAVGEWGNKDHGPSGASEMRGWYDHLVGIGCPGACYFDTNLNGGVPLSGDALVEFRRLMTDPRSVTLKES